MNIQLLTALTLICAWSWLVWHTLLKPRFVRTTHLAAHSRIAVIYASQTGTAKQIAQLTADSLGPARAQLLSMSQIRPEHLRNYHCVLFVVSTYGEGDPPDMAQAFYSQAIAQAKDASRLTHLKTAVLALGDSSYRHYCGFGAALSGWLEKQGATLLFETVQADQCSHDALLSWSKQLSQQFQTGITTEKQYSNWQLTQRRHLNPGSLGGACYELTLEPPATEACAWCAGDIAEVEIGPYGVQRDYSIASTRSEGVLYLLVRQHLDAQGKAGVGSYWLTNDLLQGDTVRLRIRENAQFHAPKEPRPAIFIGNGTGIAGLRSVLQARMEQEHYENWLIFGERQRVRDFFYEDLLNDWHAQQKLKRLDLAFSRDQAQKHYVHDVLRDAASVVRDWVARGAVIYVCGSKDGMASDVDQALKEILGNFGYAALLEQQRYRRDIY